MPPACETAAATEPPPKMPESAEAMGPSTARLKDRTARSARIERTRPLKSNLPVSTKLRKALSAPEKAPVRVSPRPFPQFSASVA